MQLRWLKCSFISTSLFLIYLVIFLFDVYVYAAAAIAVLIVVALHEVAHLKQTNYAITISCAGKTDG